MRRLGVLMAVAFVDMIGLMIVVPLLPISSLGRRLVEIAQEKRA